MIETDTRPGGRGDEWGACVAKPPKTDERIRQGPLRRRKRVRGTSAGRPERDGRKDVGKLTMPEYRAWCERQRRCEECEDEEEEALAAQVPGGGSGSGEEQGVAAGSHDIA